MPDSNYNTPQKSNPAGAEDASAKSIAYFVIWGMGCRNCAARIRHALLSIHGVSEAIIEHQDGLGQVAYDPNLVSDVLLVRVVSEAGNGVNHSYGAQLVELVENA